MVDCLIHNYNQARGYMSKMEARLFRRLDEFNRQFQDNVDRGVFKHYLGRRWKDTRDR